MNKEYKSIDEFVRELFPSIISESKNKEKQNIQDYVEKVSQDFCQQINKIIES